MTERIVGVFGSKLQGDRSAHSHGRDVITRMHGRHHISRS